MVAGDSKTDLLLKLQSFDLSAGCQWTPTRYSMRGHCQTRTGSRTRPLTGQDVPVALYLEQFPETELLLDEIEAHVRARLPRHASTGRQYFTVSVGCTGGQHRSVYLTEG